jgi:hypothetical protein
MNVASLD